MSDFLHRIFEGKGFVGPLNANAGAIVDFKLGRRVLAVVGNHVNARRLQIVQHLADFWHVLIANMVENVEPVKQRLLRLGIEQVKLKLVAHHHVEAELFSAIEQ